MPAKRSDPAINFQRNLCLLVERFNDTSTSLAAKTGLSQRTCWNLLNTTKKVSIDEADVCGRTYGYTGWQMIMPELPPNPRSIDQVLQSYLSGSDSDRLFIEQASARTSNSPTPARTPTKK